MPTDRIRDEAAGFTLIEMLVVLVILALVAGLVVTRGPPRSSRLDLRAATGQITQVLRDARSEAIATDRPVRFALDPTLRTFRVGAGPPQALSSNLRMTLVGVLDAGPVPAIVFAPDGSASGGRITLVEGAAHVLVDVDWLSGRVSVANAP